MERFQLRSVSLVASYEQPARLRARVERAVDCADGDREDIGLRQLDVLPRGAGVVARERGAPTRADEHHRRELRRTGGARPRARVRRSMTDRRA